MLTKNPNSLVTFKFLVTDSIYHGKSSPCFNSPRKFGRNMNMCFFNVLIQPPYSRKPKMLEMGPAWVVFFLSREDLTFFRITWWLITPMFYQCITPMAFHDPSIDLRVGFQMCWKKHHQLGQLGGMKRRNM